MKIIYKGNGWTVTDGKFKHGYRNIGLKIRKNILVYKYTFAINYYFGQIYGTYSDKMSV